MTKQSHTSRRRRQGSPHLLPSLLEVLAARRTTDKVAAVEQRMKNKDVADTAPQPAEHAAGEDQGADAPAKKTYKSPTISRHGNLRLMTQLE